MALNRQYSAVLLAYSYLCADFFSICLQFFKRVAACYLQQFPVKKLPEQRSTGKEIFSSSSPSTLTPATSLLGDIPHKRCFHRAMTGTVPDPQRDPVQMLFPPVNAEFKFQFRNFQRCNLPHCGKSSRRRLLQRSFRWPGHGSSRGC